ncbi:methyltransferase domain-containing protein [Streptomyces sp. NBRC 109706]|uniref:methyltransferase domain-containing protein n=1 Tax=Streptomyces sp. NBRC 109706 TaxID=1550035 RepID=UPI000784F4E8|nr:methyltransferase domain-containing protein [Streptomyces sp. NBRC 109706]
MPPSGAGAPAAGVQAPAGWGDAFAEVPRAAFLPPVIWPHDQAGETFARVDARLDPAGWRAAAESDLPVVTQWDDGAHTGEAPGREATSSASRPSLVAAMLAALDVAPGMRVLEIGTGTGWNAALLAHRLGADRVTTVEIDPAVAEAAERSLALMGSRPRVLVGDGAAGAPEHGPFDRLIVTCGVRRIPPAWLEQLVPGGLAVLPWGTPFSRHRDALLRLTVRPDGAAEGRFLSLVSFMRMRAQRDASPPRSAELPFHDIRSAAWPPHGWHPFPFFAGLRLRDAAYAVQRHDDGHTQWLYDLAGGGWTAGVRRGRVGPGVWVRQAGPRPLWDEYLDAYAWWRAAGQPDVDRLGMTVAGSGRATVWLDEPSHPVWTEPPG